MSVAATRESQDAAGLRKVVIGGVAGQTMEWYDYGLYGLLAAQIGATFFPSKDPTTSLLSAFAVFGIAFAIRPLGGLVLGPLGDRIGRRAVLTLSIGLITLATTLVGVLPGQASLGVWAPLVLVCARLLQGFSAGGEVTSAITYVAEHAPRNRRGMYTGLLQTGSALGFVLATAIILLLQTILKDASFNEFGWRIPFLLALPLGGIGLYIRYRLEESPVFEELRAKGAISRAPLKEALLGWRQLLQGIGLASLMFVGYYIFLSYMPSYMRQLGVAPATASQISLFAIIVNMFSHPVMGALSDRFGRKRVLTLAALFYVVFSWPLFAAMSIGDQSIIILCMIILAVSVAGYVGVCGALFTEFLAARTRMASFSVGYNLGGAIFGGPALYIAQYLIAATGDSRAPAFYLIFSALVSLIALATVKLMDAGASTAETQSPKMGSAIRTA